MPMFECEFMHCKIDCKKCIVQDEGNWKIYEKLYLFDRSSFRRMDFLKKFASFKIRMLGIKLRLNQSS